ncbi:hypothetical protein ACVMHW_004830 [Bradyrhizobium diazoefficiens]
MLRAIKNLGESLASRTQSHNINQSVNAKKVPAS